MCPAFGTKSSQQPSESNKGVGYDRAHQRIFNGLHKKIETTTPGSHEREALEGRLTKQQQAEEHSPLKSAIACPETLKAAGIVREKMKRSRNSAWPFKEVASTATVKEKKEKAEKTWTKKKRKKIIGG